MSHPASGENVTRLFDPDKNNHYALSEEAQLELRTLFRAMETLGTIADTPPGQHGAEIQPDHIAPIFLTFAAHGQRIMAEARSRFPSSRRKSA